ncbi:MAG: NUDIX domain-containing protein [Chloroflexi bacterium]|nr:NUDIX domain-containing protein [Chloroflexota bacterium]
MSEQAYPEPTVRILIFNPRGELLLLKSHKWPGRYVVPGGHVELGERIEQTVIREAREETGLDVRNLRFLCWQEFIHDPTFWKRRHFLFFDYACQAESTEVRLNDEAEDHMWIEPEKALELPIDSYTRVSLLEYLRIKE